MCRWVLEFGQVCIQIERGKASWKHSKFCWPFALPWSLSHKESACQAGDMGSTPGLGRSPGEGSGNPLQYSRLGNPMDREAWRAIVHGESKSWTQLSMQSMYLGWKGSLGIFCNILYICVCVCICRVLSHFGHVQLFATLWTGALQAPLSMRFSKQEY